MWQTCDSLWTIYPETCNCISSTKLQIFLTQTRFFENFLIYRIRYGYEFLTYRWHIVLFIDSESCRMCEWLQGYYKHWILKMGGWLTMVYASICKLTEFLIESWLKFWQITRFLSILDLFPLHIQGGKVGGGGGTIKQPLQ